MKLLHLMKMILIVLLIYSFIKANKELAHSSYMAVIRPLNQKVKYYILKFTTEALD